MVESAVSQALLELTRDQQLLRTCGQHFDAMIELVVNREQAQWAASSDLPLVYQGQVLALVQGDAKYAGELHHGELDLPW
jgi:hypothetical protein